MNKSGDIKLSIMLSDEDLRMLEKIKKNHKDPNLTTSIKRAVANLNFLEEETAKGKPLYVGKIWNFLLFQVFKYREVFLAK